MDPLSIAFGLAKFVPDVVKYLTGDDKSAKVAEKVVDIAKVVTGKTDPLEAQAAILADPAAQLEFQKMVMAHESDLEKAYLADLQSARQRDAEFIKAGRHNWRADSLAALAVITVIAICYFVWKDPSIPEFTKGMVTLIMGRFLGYLDQIYQFEFGSTRSNKTKDETISKLTAK